ncbi:radical SAM protein [Sedimentitalea sp.]|uniref:radical SAM/SPASM domain-containing protein n=1 Tax=Sedimentitalea sp. TaxID=2048915 RepID=UPI003298DA5F
MTTRLRENYKLIESGVGHHLFATNGSRVFDLDAATADRVAALFVNGSDDDAGRFEGALGIEHQFIESQAPEVPPLRALSLNVAQACNLGCKYCYADEGLFGGKARSMSVDTAKASVDRLMAEAGPGADVVVGFMGGEPLLNRKVVHEATAYAAAAAAKAGGRAKFTITTNATTVRDEDAQLFRDHRFMVTVSLDGGREVNDRMRPDHRGRGSYDRALAGLRRIVAEDGPGHVAARITVTRGSGDLLDILRDVLALGVGDAGFAPVQVSPDTALEFQRDDFAWFLDQMKRCGAASRDALLHRERFPFSNFETALHEIHRGSHRPYPCGAGAAYLSVNADGGLYGCHRLVDDPNWAMGDVATGPDDAVRAAHLDRRHVDRQEPCKSCWARYLCGGGCYHEVDRRGRIHCDYVRGWLEFCIAAYAELCTRIPDYFVDPENHFQAGPEAAPIN